MDSARPNSIGDRNGGRELCLERQAGRVNLMLFRLRGDASGRRYSYSAPGRPMMAHANHTRESTHRP